METPNELRANPGHAHYGAALAGSLQEPFRLLAQDTNAAKLHHEIAGNNGIDLDSIEDIYPCTPVQAGIVSQASRNPNHHFVHATFDLNPDASLVKFRAAWEEVFRTTPILRTKIVHHDRFGFVQVVLKDELEWFEADDRDSYLEGHGCLDTNAGQALSRYAITGGRPGQNSSFVWTIHRSLYDDYFLSWVTHRVSQLYLGGPCEQDSMEFKEFVAYKLKRNHTEEAEQYWASALHGCEPVHLPAALSEKSDAASFQRMEHRFEQIRRPDLSLKSSTMLYAAWSMIMRCETDSNDIIFGGINVDRELASHRVKCIAGPTISTVPVRVNVRLDKTVQDFLEEIERETRNRTKLGYIGLHKIAEINGFTRRACDFQTLLNIQPTANKLHLDSSIGQWKKDIPDTTYSLTIQVYTDKDGTEVIADYDSRTIDGWTLERWLKQLGFLLKQLAEAEADTLLGELEMMRKDDYKKLWLWNANVPSVVERCAHDLIEEKALVQPDAPAIDAWDGQLTYSELDRLATSLAHELVDKGIGSGAVALLCFEKSMWTTVAMLAVLKTGAAFCMLDPTHPESRLQKIVQQTGAMIILSSILHFSLSSRLDVRVVPVGPGLIAHRDGTCNTSALPKPDPSWLMYIVFSSGSTGVPKGSMISHSAFCSGVHYQSSKLGVRRISRVLDFSAHVFDVYIYNTGATLATGGCLCVPSESDAKENPTNCINSLKATYIDFTPSIARLVRPEMVPSVERVILGGEASNIEDLERWWKNTTVVNAYGPSECTASSVINYNIRNPSAAARIGKGVGMVTWVVDRNDYNKLLPIGVVGELLLEGPLVGNGYLNDPSKTAAAFIQDPKWLLKGTTGSPGRRGRLYKTGDLVRYNEDGSLSFVGRKDTQIKIRGQRVELGEVEHHMRECISQMAQSAQLAAEVIKPAGEAANPELAVFLSDTKAEDSSISVLAVPPDVEDKLAKRLPSYMLPTIYFILPRLPMTTTGKIDRRRLRKIGSSYSAQQLADLRGQARSEKQMPRTDTERKLQEIWAKILNLDPASIGVDDSFFRLGGDSITAMRISFEARSHQIRVSPTDILRKKTIGKLSLDIPLPTPAHKSSGATASDMIIEQSFNLTPIQQLYLSIQNNIQASFDQHVFIQLKERVSDANLSRAINTLANRHDMLRARFIQDREGRWRQLIPTGIDTSNSIRIRCTPPAQAAQIIAHSRTDLDIVHGPIVAAVLVDDGGSQSLFIAVHHLVVDPVSWRVLLQELEGLLFCQTLPPPPPISFKSWCEIQAGYMAQYVTSESTSTLPFELQPAPLSYWGLDSSIKLPQHTAAPKRKQFILNDQITSALLGSCNDAFHTQSVELMIAALIYSFTIIFPDRGYPTIFNETHDRETWNDDVDISRTVGCSTLVFPIQIRDSLDNSLLSLIPATRDCVRSFPHNGWSFLASRQPIKSTAAAHISRFPVEIIFNYHDIDQRLDGDSLFRRLPLPDEYNTLDTRSVTRALFDISFHVWEGRANVSFKYDQRMGHQDKISSWIGLYKEKLAQIPEILNDRSLAWKLSDFPMAFSTSDDLETFKDDILPQLELQQHDVEDIFPSSPMQEGIWISQIKDPSRYRVCFVFEVISRLPVDISRLQHAWNAVVRRHAILRTLLVDGIPGSPRIFNVVLKNPQPSVSVFHSSEDAVINEQLRAHYDVANRQVYDLPHHLSIYQLENRKTYLRLDINHAIVDGQSQRIIMRDLQSAYDSDLDCDARGPSYRNFVTHLEKQSFDNARQYWVDYLDGSEPCLFASMVEGLPGQGQQAVKVPGLDEEMIRTFCARFEITPATVLQAAWALLLHRYTGSVAPCFGNVTSGRDLPIDNINDMVGPLISMLPCRVRFDERKTVLDTLEAVHNDYLISLSYQSCPFSVVHQALQLGSSALFNTALSIQRLDDTEDDIASGISFNLLDCIDPTEVG
jgi:fumiquinazoline F synthetase